MQIQFNRLVGLYILLGSLISLILLFLNVSAAYFIHNLFPALFSISVITFLIICGFTSFSKPASKIGSDLLIISLLIQSIQLDVFGLYFKNYFGLYLGIGISWETDLAPIVDIKPLYTMFSNGYRNTSSNFIITFNLFPIALLLLSYLLERKAIQNQQAEMQSLSKEIE